MPNVIHVSKLGSQTALFYLTQGDAQTKAVTFVVPRNDGAENLDGLVWMLQIVNAAGQNDATGFLAEVKGSNLHMTWVCGGVLTAAAGRASIQLCGYDSTGAMQWCSGQYYIEVLERMSQTFSGEETEVMSELQILVDAAVRKAAEAADEADVAAGEARGAAASATAAANNANQAAQRAETAADNADAAAEDADRAASNAVSASEVANDAAAAAVNAAREANASATHADSMAGAAQSAANSASAAAGEANAAASNANAAAADTKAATLAVNAAIKTAQDAANEATNATAAASASSTEADAAAQRASSAATNANHKAAEAGTAANAATNAASNANAATSSANAAATAANAAATAANNAAGEAAAAKTAATTAAANADTAASNANAATSAANAAAQEAQAAAADIEAAKSAANTAASEANSAAASAKSAASSALNAYSVASAAAARAETVANMTVEAETLNPGSQATAQYKDGKLTLGIPRGEDGSGGAGMPAGEAPYQMLATGPDGKTQWVDRTHYDYPAETILPLTDLQLIGGYCTFKDPFDTIPTIGMPYHVTYYGYDYDLIAKEWMEDGVRCVTLGNQRDLGGTDWTQEPFIIVFYPEKSIFGTYGYFSCSATNKDTMPVSIESVGVLKKIDPKFLPDGVGGGGMLPTGGEPYKQLVTDGQGNAVWEDRLAYEEANALVEILPETACSFQEMACNIFEPLQGGIIPGEEYTVVFDGNIYKTTAKEFSDGGMTATVLGSTAFVGGEDTGEPFFAVVTPPELSELAGGATLMINSLDENFSPETLAILGIVKVVHTIPMKYLPDNLYGDFEHKQKTILEETEVDFTGSDVGYLTTPLKEGLQIGREYLVNFNGAEYSIICTDENNVYGELECEQFRILILPAPYEEEGLGVIHGMVNLYDASLQGSIVTLSIEMAAYTEVKKVPDKYIRETAPVIVRIKGDTNSVTSVSHTYEELEKEYEAGRTIVCIWEKSSRDHRVGQFASYNSSGGTLQFHYEDSTDGGRYVFQVGRYKNEIRAYDAAMDALYLMSTGPLRRRMKITVDDNGAISATDVS